MKIAIVTNLYPPFSRGGAEVVITRVVTELLSQGHKVFIVTSRPFAGPKTLIPRLEDTSTERIFRFFPLNIYHVLRDHKHPAPIRLLWHMIDTLNPLNGFLVRELLHEERPDIIYTHNLKGLGFTVMAGLRTLGIPIVHHVHDVQLVEPSGLILAGQEKPKTHVRLGRSVYAFVCRLLFGSPTVVISPSEFLKKFYDQYRFFRQSDVRVMPNPAPKFRSQERGSRVDGPLRLLFLGQLAEHKGIRFLMNGLDKLDIPFELSIAGEGEIGAWVLEKAKQDKRTVYVGYASLSQILRLFDMADALVVPSLCYENSPTVIYEALQAGLPVVAADIGGVAELIQEGKNGYLFTTGDQQDLLATLHVLDREKVRLRADAKAIEATVGEYAIEKYVERLIALFTEAIAKPR